MRAAVWTGPGSMELQNLPTPEIGPGDALIRVNGAGVCGSDLHVWHGMAPDRNPPLILGHETAGQIVSPIETNHLQRGDFVAIYPVLGCGACAFCQRGREALCRHKKPRGIYAAGGFAEFIRSPLNNLYPIKARTSLGALVEPLATAIHFVNTAKKHKGPAAILGLGPIGLLIQQVARLHGFSQLAAVESNAHRAQVAVMLGTQLIVHPTDPDRFAKLSDFFGEDGCAVVWNTAGVTPARQLALRLVRSEGLIVEIGLSQPTTEIDFDELIRREIQLVASYAYTRSEFAEAVELIEQEKLLLDDLVSEAPLADIQNVFSDLGKPDTKRVKVILRP